MDYAAHGLWFKLYLDCQLSNYQKVRLICKVLYRNVDPTIRGRDNWTPLEIAV